MIFAYLLLSNLNMKLNFFYKKSYLNQYIHDDISKEIFSFYVLVSFRFINLLHYFN